MLPPGLLVVHDASGGGQYDEPELSTREKVVGPLLYFGDGHIKPGRDDPALVESSRQIDHNLASSVVVHHLELPDVSVFHHDGEEPHDDLTLSKVSSVFKQQLRGRAGHLGAGSDENLSLASFLSIVDAFKSVSQ